jgi:hypothetical protein
MPRRHTPKPSKTYITTVIKGVIAGGVPLERIKGVRTSGEGVVVLIGDPDVSQSENEWDAVLKQ